jgi:hypothetical protein
MSQKRRQGKSGDLPRIGDQPPRYRFILNPYVDARFTVCPECNRKTGQRKLPLWIHVDPMNPVALNYTCRYCSHCDVLIAHLDEIEGHLANVFAERNPDLIGNDYLVLGTVDRDAWKRGLDTPLAISEMRTYLHDFKEVLTIKATGGWVRE